MAKIIIGIHGLGNKPPAKILEGWWKRAISDGLRGQGYNVPEFEFKLVYWADVLHPLPLDLEDIQNKSFLYVPETYPPEDFFPAANSGELRKKAKESMAKYYEQIWVERILPLNKPSLTELFVHLHLRDLESYYTPTLINYSGSTQLARDVIVGRAIQTLEEYCGKDILLIAHSMGSVIIHDAFAGNRGDPLINTLVTIGSPLAHNYVVSRMRIEENVSFIDKLKVPAVVCNRWLNLWDLEDQIANTGTLFELYKPNAKGVKVEDILVHNRYAANGMQNPHSSFGYLRTKEMADTVNSFLTRKEPGLFTRIWDKVWKTLKPG